MTTDANGRPYTESAATAHEADVERTTLTQSASGGTTQVQVPSGAEVVRIQVTPGETIQLPFPQDRMLARLDDGSGNLAVRSGDVTVILLGYANATDEAEVALIDANGVAIDIAAVVAATDPNLEISTAAGPAAGDQGAGVDNNGGVFTPFDPATGLGGLNAVGGLQATELQYGLIQRQAVVFEVEEEEGDTSPVLVTLTPGLAVNEDDLERQESESFAKALEPYPSHVLDGLDSLLGSGSYVYWAGPHEQGNDPFDTDDHEDGSQVPGLKDDVGGVDQDREPLTSTAVASVNFFGDVPGHLSFTNGTTPILEQLSALGLTSHSHELLFVVLPGSPDTDPTAVDNSHGETLVAYYVETYGEGEQTQTIAHVVFTIGFREFEGIDPISDFNIDFTIYGVIDNVPGILDADGDILAALDIDVPFFMVDSNGSVTPAPVGSAEGGVTFTDIDDVPSFGWIKTEWVEEEDEGEGEGKDSKDGGEVELLGGMILPVGKVPSDDGIVVDESNGEQDPDDVKPAEYSWTIGSALEGAGWKDLTPLGAAISSVTVSFGADGRAEGNDEAGKTAFKGDDDDWVNTDPNASAFQFVVGGGEIERGATNWTIIGPDGQILRVHALQLDAHTIVGFANPADPDGDSMVEGLDPLSPWSPGSIPVFLVKIDADIGQVVLVQLHQVNHADTTDADEATLPLQIYGQGETPTTITFQHDFNDLDGWTTVAGGNAAIVGPLNTGDEQPNQSGQVRLQPGNADAAAIETLFGFAAGSLAAAANDGEVSNGVEAPTNGTAIRSVIDVQAGDTLSVTFNFLDAEGFAGPGTYQDFGFVVIGDEVIRLSNSGEANNYSFDFSEESGYLTFTYTFDASGPVQIGFGVMNESDTSVLSELLVDQVLLTHGNEGMPIVVRATDYDGDYADLPYNVTIRDDGPSLSLEGYTNDHDAEGEGTPSNGSGYGYLDEDWLKDGNNDKDLSATDDIGGTKSIASLILTPGTDGGALELDAAAITVSGNVGMGLIRSLDAAPVIMVNSGDGQVVTGYADADFSGTISLAEMIDANKVFTITVVGNTVEFELFQALVHDVANDKDVGDSNTESQIFFDVPVSLVDGDGDKATLSVKFLVDDDQVAAVDDAALVSTGLDVATVGVNLMANDALGADRPGEVTHVIIDGTEYALPLGGSKFAIGEDGKLTSVGLEVGILEVGRDGNWSFTQTNNTESFEPAAMNFSYRVEDGDGDTDTANFSVQAKHYRAPTFEDETAIVDEDGLPTGANDSPDGKDGTKGDNVGGHQYGGQPDPATESVSRNTLGNGFNWYGDVGTLKFSFENDAQLSGVFFQNGGAATLANIEGNGTDHLTIWDGVPGESNKVLELTVIDVANAVYEVKLLQPLKHPSQDDLTTPEKETFFEDDINIPVTVTATNFGGSTEHTLTVRVDDDFMGQWGWSTNDNTTIFNGDLYVWVDEDYLAGGNKDTDANGNPNHGLNGDDPEWNVSPDSILAGTSASLKLSAVFGADGAGDLPYGLAVLTPGSAYGGDAWGPGNPLETTLGSSLKVLSSSATSLVISDMSDNPVFTLTCDQVTGVVTFTQHQAVDHRGNNGENDAYLRFNVTYTDGDGDTRVDDIGFAIDDDAPETKNSTSGLTFAVDEKDMGTDDTTSYEWMFQPVNYGADGKGTVSYKLGGVDGQPLADTVTTYKDSVSGEFIKLHQVDSNTIEGRTENGGELVFVVTHAGGLVKFDLKRGIDHSDAEFDVTALALPIHIVQSSSDLDGDVAIAVATTNMVVMVDDSKVDAKDDGTFAITQTGKYDGVSLAKNDSFGADGPGKVTKVTINNNDYPMVGTSVSIALTGGTLTVNEDGTWHFNQPSLVPFAITYNFSYTISDGDGDTDTATFSVQPAVGKNEAPVAAGDLVISLQTGTTAIPEWALLRNDSDKEGAALDVVNVASFASGTGAHNAGTGTGGNVFFNDTGSTGGASNGSFNYQASDGSTTSGNAVVSIDVREVTNTFGTDNAEIIIGNDKNNELSGQGGNDIILGGIGNDELFGGAGIDWLFGESGDDTLIYDSQDKFDGSTGDDALYSNVAGTDFDFKSRSADGSHRMTDIEWVNLGDFNDGTSNKTSIALNDVLNVNIATVGSPDGNIHQIDLFVVGDHEGAVRDGVDLSGFTRLDVNGATAGLGTFNNTIVTGTAHNYQVWEGTNNLGQKITLAIEDGLTVVTS